HRLINQRGGSFSPAASHGDREPIRATHRRHDERSTSTGHQHLLRRYTASRDSPSESRVGQSICRLAGHANACCSFAGEGAAGGGCAGGGGYLWSGAPSRSMSSSRLPVLGRSRVLSSSASSVLVLP